MTDDFFYVWGSTVGERKPLERCSTRKSRAIKKFHKVKTQYAGMDMVFLAKMMKDGNPDVVVAT